jgi:hypothetical protein
MQHPVFIEAWLLWLRPLRAAMQVGGLNRYYCPPGPVNLVADRWTECVRPKAEIAFPDAVRAWLEDWWNLTGVMPRSLYIEAVRRNEALRTRLEEAEAALQQLRAGKAQETQGNEIVHAWETAIHQWQSAIESTFKRQDAVDADADWD